MCSGIQVIKLCEALHKIKLLLLPNYYGQSFYAHVIFRLITVCCLPCQLLSLSFIKSNTHDYLIKNTTGRIFGPRETDSIIERDEESNDLMESDDTTLLPKENNENTTAPLVTAISPKVNCKPSVTNK